jgi:hypothetical protein
VDIAEDMDRVDEGGAVDEAFGVANGAAALGDDVAIRSESCFLPPLEIPTVGSAGIVSEGTVSQILPSPPIFSVEASSLENKVLEATSVAASEILEAISTFSRVNFGCASLSDGLAGKPS